MNVNHLDFLGIYSLDLQSILPKNSRFWACSYKPVLEIVGFLQFMSIAKANVGRRANSVFNS